MRLVQLSAAVVWGGMLGFDPPLHQLDLKVELEVQSLTTPPEAVCKTPGSQEKSHRDQGRVLPVPA